MHYAHSHLGGAGGMLPQNYKSVFEQDHKPVQSYLEQYSSDMSSNGSVHWTTIYW